MKPAEVIGKGELRRRLEMIEAIGDTLKFCLPARYDAWHERLLGAEQALKFALGARNYVDFWTKTLGKEIREAHRLDRENCGCGVCSRLEAAEVKLLATQQASVQPLRVRDDE